MFWNQSIYQCIDVAVAWPWVCVTFFGDELSAMVDEMLRWQNEKRSWWDDAIITKKVPYHDGRWRRAKHDPFFESNESSNGLTYDLYTNTKTPNSIKLATMTHDRSLAPNSAASSCRCFIMPLQHQPIEEVNNTVIELDWCLIMCLGVLWLVMTMR